MRTAYVSLVATLSFIAMIGTAPAFAAGIRPKYPMSVPNHVQFANCIPNNHSCRNSGQCCSGTCAERGSKGWLCV
jgi:hypothetical protein